MNTKLKSTTFWIALIWSLYIPISYIIQFLHNRYLLIYALENGFEPSQLLDYRLNIPLGNIITAAGLVVGAYVGGNKLRNVSTNLTMPIGKDGRDIGAK
jgi:hypothetical protein